LAQLAYDRGRIGEWKALQGEQRRLDLSVGRNASELDAALTELFGVAQLDMPVDAHLKALDAALLKEPIQQLPVQSRPYVPLAIAYSVADRPDRARAILRRYDADVTDSVVRRMFRNGVDAAEATIALAEGRWAEASEMIRRFDRLPDGPAGRCGACLSYNLLWLFSKAGMADSVLAEYDAYRATGYGARERDGPDVDLGAPIYLSLARIYDAKGDTANAVAHYREFIELWKDADPELQPRVAAARERLRQLTPTERPRR